MVDAVNEESKHLSFGRSPLAYDAWVAGASDKGGRAQMINWTKIRSCFLLSSEQEIKIHWEIRALSVFEAPPLPSKAGPSQICFGFILISVCEREKHFWGIWLNRKLFSTAFEAQRWQVGVECRGFCWFEQIYFQLNFLRASHWDVEFSKRLWISWATKLKFHFSWFNSCSFVPF